MKRFIIITLVFVAIAIAATRVYDIEPYQNCNGKTREIGQIFVATCDSFVWAEVFIGAANNVGEYNFRIEEYPTGIRIAAGDTTAGPNINYDYVRAYLVHFPNAKVIKGKQYLLKITHSNGDSINYYYNPNNPYQYGMTLVPPQGSQIPIGLNLAVRIAEINASCCDWLLMVDIKAF